MGYDFNDYKKDEMDRPMTKAWANWWKREKVGDMVQGYIRDAGYRPAEGVYKDSRVITLEQPDGTLINVSIKRLDFILDKTSMLRMGDPLTVVFEESRPPKTAGFSPTKVDGFYGKNLPENAGNKTVAEMEALDIGVAAKRTDEVEASNKEFEGAGKAAAAETPAPAEAPTA